MGDHYAPRKYLAGFCDPKTPSRIWTYDRVTGKHFQASLANIAQENDFYSREDEADLNALVEMPANEVLDKLRDSEEIATLSDADRMALACYIAVFIKRVPRHRQRACDIAPTLFNECIDRCSEMIRQEGIALGKSADQIQKGLADIERVRLQYESDPATLVWEQIRSPWPTEELCNLVFSMTWRFFEASGPSYFLTSDNPVFFFDCWGMGKPESEFSFPISSKLILHGIRLPDRQGRCHPANQQLVKEFNRRTASYATRFLFYHRSEVWIRKVGDKKRPTSELKRVN